MSVNVHITHIADTDKNVRANRDLLQFGVLTDGDRDLWYANDDNTRLYYVAAQYYWNGVALNYVSADHDDITAHGSMYVANYLYHYGDTDNYWRFQPDQQTQVVGGVEMWDYVENDGQDYAEFNSAEADVDFIVNSTIADTFFVRGSDGVLEIGGTGTPTWEKDWHTLAFGDNTAVSANGATLYMASRTYYDETDSRWEDDGSANTASLFSILNGDFKFEAAIGSGALGTATVFVELLSVLHTSGYAGEVVVNDDNEYIDFRCEGATAADLLLVDSSADKIAMNGAAGNGILTIQQDDASGEACLVLDQDDESEGFIDFVGSDRGAIATSTTNSAASVRVELSGTKYIVPLFTDA